MTYRRLQTAAGRAQSDNMPSLYTRCTDVVCGSRRDIRLAVSAENVDEQHL